LPARRDARLVDRDDYGGRRAALARIESLVKIEGGKAQRLQPGRLGLPHRNLEEGDDREREPQRAARRRLAEKIRGRV
jgi:hypothetical protein